MSTLDDIIAKLAPLPQAEQDAVWKDAHAQTKAFKWVPNPGPQTDAYFSKADVLLYGGEPGGGKSQLILGLAFNEHKRTLLMRRQYGELDRLVEDALKIHGSKVGFNGSPPPKLKISDTQIIDFAAAHRVGDEQSQMGKGRDLLCVGRGTLVIMLDGTSKPIEDIRRGDMVLTLEGPKPVINIMPVRRDYAVRVTLPSGAQQVQSMAHSLLSTAGWVAYDMLCESLPSCSSSPIQCREACKTSSPCEPIFSASPPRHERIETGLSQLAGPGQQVSDRSSRTGTCACTLRLAQESVCAASYGSSQGPSRHSGSNSGAAHLQQPQAKVIRSFFSLLSGWRGASDVHASSSPGGLLDHCSSDNGQYDKRPLLLIRPDQSQADDQVSSHQQDDAARQSPIDSGVGGLGKTPRCTIHKGSYCHPYTKEIRQTDDVLNACSFDVVPVGVVELHDIEVQDANHYITLGGFVNKNCIDEATHFAEQQIRFLMGWNRSEDPGQRVRTVLATNPPLTAEGLWVIEMFAPWLDPRYPNPAKSGELRWVVSDDDGMDEWVDGPDDVRVNASGKTIRPTSRTYIPAKVSDNPYYAASDYERQLDAMPEPYRSLLMGGFKTSFKDAPDQIIPTKWVQLAQERWINRQPKGVPMCAIGVDASGGGDDPMIMAPRYDGWYPTLIEVPGKDLPMDNLGPTAAGRVIVIRRDNALVVVDMSGGFGGSMYDHLRHNNVDVKAYKGAESSARRSADGKLRFTNKRTAAIWGFMEALDPGQPNGSPIQLPPDPRLVADLTAPTFKITPNGIKAESKEDVCARLGRSTDRGDAVIMAWHEGPRKTTDAMDWMDLKQTPHGLRKMPQVINTGRKPLSARARS